MDEKYYLLALRYLQYRDRSTKEMRDYLQRKNASENQIIATITKLHEQKFLDDVKFAKMWISNRIALRPTGKKLLHLELLQKGITKDVIDTVLEASEEENGNDRLLAITLLQKKKDKYKNLSYEELFRKAGGFLQRRGFAYDDIKYSIDEVFRK